MSQSAASWKCTELALELVLQAGLILGLGALSFWLWPERMFDSATAIQPGDWLLASLSLWVGVLALLTFYFLAVTPLLALLQNQDDAASSASSEYESDQAKNL